MFDSIPRRNTAENDFNVRVKVAFRFAIRQFFTEGIAAEHLLADKAYDTNEIIDTATERGMNPVIPPKSNRREKREYDRALYKLRHLVENGFLDFKQWRGVATRYTKNSLPYLAICQIRAMVIWAKLI